MSYCRFSRDSDVYAYDAWGDGDGESDSHIMCWVSAKARRMGFKDQEFDEPTDFLAYLKELKAGGLMVPDFAIQTVEAEMKESA